MNTAEAVSIIRENIENKFVRKVKSGELVNQYVFMAYSNHYLCHCHYNKYGAYVQTQKKKQY